MTSQSGQQIITIHILPNISRSKGNQLIEYTKRTVFYSKTMQKMRYGD